MCSLAREHILWYCSTLLQRNLHSRWDRGGGMDGLELAGRPLKVNVAKDREESDERRDRDEDDFDDE